MMKKILISVIALFSILLCFYNVSRETYNVENIYSDTMAVIDCKYKSNETTIVTFINANGFVYEYVYNDWDIYPEEIYSVTFYNNKTSCIMDDEIIGIKYQRIDLLNDQLSNFQCCSINPYINNN